MRASSWKRWIWFVGMVGPNYDKDQSENELLSNRLDLFLLSHLESDFPAESITERRHG